MERLYLYQLTNYNKILVQRNNLLKQIRFQNNLIETLEAWDIQLVKNMAQRLLNIVKNLSNIWVKFVKRFTIN